MAFTDEDLKMLKEDIMTGSIPEFIWLADLVERLASAENIIREFDKKKSGLDYEHPAIKRWLRACGK